MSRYTIAAGVINAAITWPLVILHLTRLFPDALWPAFLLNFPASVMIGGIASIVQKSWPMSVSDDTFVSISLMIFSPLWWMIIVAGFRWMIRIIILKRQQR